jgi:hypothetical protein
LATCWETIAFVLLALALQCSGMLRYREGRKVKLSQPRLVQFYGHVSNQPQHKSGIICQECHNKQLLGFSSRYAPSE